MIDTGYLIIAFGLFGITAMAGKFLLMYLRCKEVDEDDSQEVKK